MARPAETLDFGVRKDEEVTNPGAFDASFASPPVEGGEADTELGGNLVCCFRSGDLRWFHTHSLALFGMVLHTLGV